ncbi:MAG TPA: response regulator transcription factor [Candidatus Choladousia intestinipullorum]|nr:response regulator transcription factor [Candidatus Choladousia intestinipullorum]
MVPIYLCDDEPGIRRAIRREIEKEILISGYDMEIAAECAAPEDVLSSLQNNRRRGIYFLDVDLKNERYTGFTLGQAIRREDPRGFLIYVTAFRELAFETFRYQLEALDYIVKDDPEEMFAGIRRCLASVVERLQSEKEDSRKYFTVKFMDTVRHIPIDDILFFETGAKSHRIILHGLKERLDFTGSIQELQQDLGQQFLRIHRAYLANVNQIKYLDVKERKVIFSNGEACWFSRKAKQELLRLNTV